MASQAQPILRTPRLFLRLADPSSESDSQELLSLYNHPTLAKEFASGMRTHADIQAKVRTHGPKADFCTKTSPPDGMWFLTYLLPSEEAETAFGTAGAEITLIGSIALNFRDGMPYPDLGYAMLPQFQARGYATEAGQAVLKFWREDVGVKEVCIGTAPYNIPGQKLAEKLGFVRAGTFDVLIGRPPNQTRETGGLGYVLPGMEWIEGRTMVLTVGADDS